MNPEETAWNVRRMTMWKEHGVKPPATQITGKSFNRPQVRGGRAKVNLRIWEWGGVCTGTVFCKYREEQATSDLCHVLWKI